MKEIKIRYSKQRELIFNNLKHRYDHPTAEMIYQDLKVDYPHLSLGTVYRNLNQLVETKQIKKLDLGDTMVHYDGNIQPHMHFMCNCCQTIYDLDNNDKKIIKQFEKTYKHHIDVIDIDVFYNTATSAGTFEAQTYICSQECTIFYIDILHTTGHFTAYYKSAMPM